MPNLQCSKQVFCEFFFTSDAGLSIKLYFFDKFLVCNNMTSDNKEIIDTSKNVVIKICLDY